MTDNLRTYLKARLRTLDKELHKLFTERQHLHFVRDKLTADIETNHVESTTINRERDSIMADLLDMERDSDPLCFINGHDWPRLSEGAPRKTSTCGRCGAQRIPTDREGEPGWRYVYPRKP